MANLMKSVLGSFELPVSKSKNGYCSVFVASRYGMFRRSSPEGVTYR